jgi:hypothetical protein
VDSDWSSVAVVSFSAGTAETPSDATTGLSVGCVSDAFVLSAGFTRSRGCEWDLSAGRGSAEASSTMEAKPLSSRNPVGWDGRSVRADRVGTTNASDTTLATDNSGDIPRDWIGGSDSGFANPGPRRDGKKPR